MGASNSRFQNLKQNRISQSIYTKLRGSSFQRKAPPHLHRGYNKMMSFTYTN